MIPKISLTAAFLLMVAPPMACASDRAARNPAPIARQAHGLPPGMVVAQGFAVGVTPNVNESDSNSSDNADDNQNADDDQNADTNQTNQQYPPTSDQPIPSLAPNGNEPDGTPQADQAPQPQPMNPYQ